MPRAVVLNSAVIVGATGGTFADTFVINSGDSLSVANYDTGGARLLEAWAIDTASVADISWFYTRQESTHDQNFGMRFAVPSVALGGAGTNAAFNLLPGDVTVPVFKSDNATIKASCTASDNLLMSWLTEYDDLPGASANFSDPATVLSMRKSTLGIRVDAVASGTSGSYGTGRAFNADDARLHANTYYAILGCSVQTQVTTVALNGPAWGGFKIGMPCGSLDLRSDTWFLDQSKKWNKPLIPILNSNDVGNVNVFVANAATSTSPKIRFLMYELTGNPVTGA